MTRSSDITIGHISLEFIPVQTRVPLKFGNEVLSSVTCAQACMEVSGVNGQRSLGWGKLH